jgi:hypothetical protein
MIDLSIPSPTELGFDLVITRLTRQGIGYGTWVTGRVFGHRFEALVFSEHAQNPAWEIGQSRISKLWVQRRGDRFTVFNWDRGMDLEPMGPMARAIVEFLVSTLAERVYG